MKIGIIGAGNVATALAKFWSASGHSIVFGVRDPSKAGNEKIGSFGRLVSVAESAAFGEVLVLAVPYWTMPDALRRAGSIDRKILMCCVNALKQDYSGLVVGTTTSAAEEAATLAPGARVVSGLPAFAELMHSPSQTIAGQPGTLFVAGEDQAAKDVVSRLLAETGAEVVDAGPLRAARYIEPAMMLLVHMAYAQGLGGKIALRLVR